MDRTRTNFIVDTVIFLAMVVVLFSGVVLWGWLKPVGMGGPGQNRGGQAAAEKSAPGEMKERPAENKGESKSEAALAKGRIFWGLFEANSFWGMTKNGGWKSIHCWVGVAVLLPFLIFHLLLHWKWIKAVCARKKRLNQADESP